LASPTATADLDRTARPRTQGLGQLVRQALKPLASLRLTVFLFVLSVVLVFCGTVAQIDNGNWTVVKDYFRSFFVWVPLQLFVQVARVFLVTPDGTRIISQSAFIPGSLPFPGGWTIGGVLLVNLLAAHLTRFR